MMSQGSIYLVRHGEDNRSELTGLGRVQAAQAATKLASFFDETVLPTLITSDRLRAGQTADIIAKTLNLDVLVSKKLGDGGNVPEIVGALTPYLVTCLEEAGVAYDPTEPLIVVTHAPMLAAAKGVRSFEIANGQVELYDGHTWDIEL